MGRKDNQTHLHSYRIKNSTKKKIDELVKNRARLTLVDDELICSNDTQTVHAAIDLLHYLWKTSKKEDSDGYGKHRDSGRDCAGERRDLAGGGSSGGGEESCELSDGGVGEPEG